MLRIAVDRPTGCNYPRVQPVPETSVIGERISRHQALSHVARGGMGEAYLAEDTKLGRRVALEFLPPAHSADEAAQRRLAREGQAAAGLYHPFICKIFEVGQGDGLWFIAMEYVEGTTLKARLEHGPLEPRESIRIACEVAARWQSSRPPSL